MKKFLKIVKIVLISLLVSVLIAYVVLYIVNVDLARQIMATAVEYANKPLPIIGVSGAILAYLVYKVFSSTIFGKKYLAAVKERYESQVEGIQAKYDEYKAKVSSVISLQQAENDAVIDYVHRFCEAMPNKKINALGEELREDMNARIELLREKSKVIAETSVEKLTQSKDEIVNEVLEKVRKELEGYGKKGKEAIESLPEAEEI